MSNFKNVKDNKQVKYTRPTKDEIYTSKDIKELIKLGKFQEACKLTTKYPNNPIIQVQRMNLLIGTGKYEQAEEIGKREIFKDNEVIQSVLMKLYTLTGNYIKAKEIGNRKEYINNPVFQSQLMTIATKLGKYEEAEEIGNKETLKEDIVIQ